MLHFALTSESGSEPAFVLTDASGAFVLDEVGVCCECRHISSPQLHNAGDAAAECAKHIFAFFRKSIERRLVRERKFDPAAPVPAPAE